MWAVVYVGVILERMSGSICVALLAQAVESAAGLGPPVGTNAFSPVEPGVIRILGVRLAVLV
jgi:hypothetical protein